MRTKTDGSQEVEPNFCVMPHCKNDDDDDDDTSLVPVDGIEDISSVNYLACDHSANNSSSLPNHQKISQMMPKYDPYYATTGMNEFPQDRLCGEAFEFASFLGCSDKGYLSKADVPVYQTSRMIQPFQCQCGSSCMHTERDASLFQHPSWSMEANHLVRSSTSESMDNRCNHEDYHTPYSFVQHTQREQVGTSNNYHECGSMQQFEDDDESFYKTSMNDLSLQQAATFRRMQILQTLHQLRMNLRGEESSQRVATMYPQESSSTSIHAGRNLTDEHASVWNDRDSTAALYQYYNEHDGSMDSYTDNTRLVDNSTISEKEMQMSEAMYEMKPQANQNTNSPLDDTHQQQQDSVNQVDYMVDHFEGYLFHALDCSDESTMTEL
jgi:hypothetical protein